MKKDQNIRKLLEENENLCLHEKAAKSCNSQGREREEPLCDIRPIFQHDRDRVLHSKSFRRLKHKTQVFLAPAGDHYRTRLTHTLEVSQIARTISKSLRLNESLTEAISLAHDLGHTPFGHAGEDSLNSIFPDGFRHVEHSLRVVKYLERDGKGLNLSKEVCDGIVKHSKGKGPIILSNARDRAMTLEGQVVRISDIIAYLNHDMDDALRAGLINEKSLPKEVIKILGKRHSERIDRMIKDVINETNRIDLDSVTISEKILEGITLLRDFLYENLYEGERFGDEFLKSKRIIKELYYYYLENIDKFNDEYRNNGDQIKRRIVDYIAGMTDRYAIQKYEEIFIPKSWHVL